MMIEMVDGTRSRTAADEFGAAARAVRDGDCANAVRHVHGFAESVFPHSDGDGDPFWTIAARTRLVSLACLAVTVAPPGTGPRDAIGPLIGHGSIDVVGAVAGMLRTGSDGAVLRDQMLMADDAFRSACSSRKMRETVDAMIEAGLAAGRRDVSTDC